MSSCDCQKNIKKPIGNGLLMTTVAGIFFGPMVVGVAQQLVLLTCTSLVYLMSLPVFRSDWKKAYTING